MGNIAPPAANDCRQIRSVLSLDPLMEFWENSLAPKCGHMAQMLTDIKNRMPEALLGDIQDISLLRNHSDIIPPLMTAIVPPASLERDLIAAFTPCSFETFYATPEFQRLFLDSTNAFKADLVEKFETEEAERSLRAFHLILDRIYKFDCPFFKNLEIKILPDQETGLDRYYEEYPDFKFVELKALEPPRPISEQERNLIMNHITDAQFISQYIDLDKFQIRGFVIIRVKDVTQREIISALERDLVDRNSIFSSNGIRLLESRLHALFRKSNIAVGVASLQGDQVLITKNDHNSNINCLFSNSHHYSLEDLKDSVWLEAVKADTILRVPDLSKKENITPSEKGAVGIGIRSMLLSPLSFQGENIGFLELLSPVPNDLGPFDAILLEQITPIFSVALKRGQDELGKHVQSVIKEQCTAVHPSVEWRFEKAALAHLENLHQGNASSRMEDIVFKDVVPFYGQSDIRGSSKARNRGIQRDLSRQLFLALEILEKGAEHRPWPLLKEYAHRIQHLIDKISSGVTSSDENTVFSLLNEDMAPTFDTLAPISSEMAAKIEGYRNALDPGTGMIHDKRKEYEDSVWALNSALSAYLEQEDSLIQQTFPHYFEKRQTDGVDYMMYIGASMMESQDLSKFHVKDMTLWQMMMACGLAWHTERVKPELKVNLDTCHLILVNHTPLSIRFRYDEKRFDVDGAYDVRHEIIKSRLDKALVKGTGQRLTQPGRIALVYSTPAEGKEIREHIEFLTNLGKLDKDQESLELDDLPDVRGLKALRVGVNLKSSAMENIISLRAG